jgi:hypothetical protein
LGTNRAVREGDAVDDGDYRWVDGIDAVDWKELSNLYRIAPLGDTMAIWHDPARAVEIGLLSG